jgi:hypothetical protein
MTAANLTGPMRRQSRRWVGRSDDDASFHRLLSPEGAARVERRLRPVDGGTPRPGSGESYLWRGRGLAASRSLRRRCNGCCPPRGPVRKACCLQTPERPMDHVLGIVRKDEILVDSTVGMEGKETHRADSVDARAGDQTEFRPISPDQPAPHPSSHLGNGRHQLLEPVEITAPRLPTKHDPSPLV